MRPLCTGKRNHNHVRAGEKNRFFRNEGKPPARPSHLVAHVDVGVLGQQERHQVHAALLRRQVDGADALPRHRVGVGAVLQQRGPDVHLVLLGGDVEGRVAVLKESGWGGRPGLNNLPCCTVLLQLCHRTPLGIACEGGKKASIYFTPDDDGPKLELCNPALSQSKAKKKL